MSKHNHCKRHGCYIVPEGIDDCPACVDEEINAQNSSDENYGGGDMHYAG